MKIIDNMATIPERPLEKGDVLIGKISGDYLIIVNGGEQAMNLNSLRVYKLSELNLKNFNRTNITFNDVTVTFG